jgi:hypothetical protein
MSVRCGTWCRSTLDGRWHEAVTLWEALLLAHPRDLLALECNLYPQAEAAGREALARDQRGPWAIHGVAQVMEMQGRHTEGVVWLQERHSDWSNNGLAVHLWWHLALFRLETLDTAAALALFDARGGYAGFARAVQPRAHDRAGSPRREFSGSRAEVQRPPPR